MDAAGLIIQGASFLKRIARIGQNAESAKEMIAKIRCITEYPTKGVGKIVSPKVAIADRNKAIRPGSANVRAEIDAMIVSTPPKIKNPDMIQFTGDSGAARSLMV